MVSVELLAVDPPMHGCSATVGKWPIKCLSRPYSIGSLDDDRAPKSACRSRWIASALMISIRNTAEAITLPAPSSAISVSEIPSSLRTTAVS